MTTATNPFSASDSWQGYFSGHNILNGVITDMKFRHGATVATDVILSGCSAGGIGAFDNCDFFAEAFPKARAACRPESGYFGLPITPYSAWSKGQSVPDPEMHHDSDSDWLALINAYINPAMAACNMSTNNGHNFPYCKGIDRGCCDKVPYYYPFTKTRMFIAQNTMDSYQIAVQGGGSPWDARYVSYVQGVISGYLTSTYIHGPKSATDGMFTTACFAHCNTVWSSGSVIDGKTGAQAFGDWYFGRSAKAMHLDNSSSPDCGQAAKESVLV